MAIRSRVEAQDGESRVVDIEAVIAAAQQAGALVGRMWQEGLRQVGSKSNEIDLVTEADMASEKLLREELHRLFPQAGFWGEESNQRPDEEYYWLVDPIDGTTNYAAGLPNYAVSIGLYRGDVGLLGVVLALPYGRVYWGERGRGAFVREPDGRERRMQVNQVNRLRGAILSTGFPYDRAENPDNNVAEFQQFVLHCQDIRRMGSAAIDLALVADGALTAHWELALNPWDVAAGFLLVEEAGGLVTGLGGEPWTLTGRRYIAGNGQPELHRALVEGMRRARNGRGA